MYWEYVDVQSIYQKIMSRVKKDHISRDKIQNNRSTRALYVFVHFFSVLFKTTTWNDQI